MLKIKRNLLLTPFGFLYLFKSQKESTPLNPESSTKKILRW